VQNIYTIRAENNPKYNLLNHELRVAVAGDLDLSLSMKLNIIGIPSNMESSAQSNNQNKSSVRNFRLSFNSLFFHTTVVRRTPFTDNANLGLPMSKQGSQGKRHGDEPQHKAEDHLVHIRPVRGPDHIGDGAANGLPGPQDARHACHVAEPPALLPGLRADLAHEPVQVRLQGLVEEAEEHVDGEGGPGKGAAAEVKGGVGLGDQGGLDDGVPDPAGRNEDYGANVKNAGLGGLR
jgi:hypothetical protein